MGAACCSNTGEEALMVAGNGQVVLVAAVLGKKRLLFVVPFRSARSQTDAQRLAGHSSRWRSRAICGAADKAIHLSQHAVARLHHKLDEMTLLLLNFPTGVQGAGR